MDDPIYIGIDPGANGAAVAIWQNGAVDSFPLSATKAGLLQWLRSICESGPTLIAVESNTGYVGDGGNPGSAMFKFGRITGICEMAVVAAWGQEPIMVHSRRWQNDLGINPKAKDETRQRFKARLKSEANRLLSRGLTLKDCDAALIALWLKRGGR